MTRRKILLTASAAVLAATIAMAGEFEDSLVAQLTSQGYTSFSFSRTWLGRIRIVAMSATHRREIILNRNTGEILRDFEEVIGENGESLSGLFKNDFENVRRVDSVGGTAGGDDSKDDDDDDDDSKASTIRVDN